MQTKKPSNKIISLSDRIANKKRVIQTKNKNCERQTRVIAVTSGKGGVGKTNIVANLGFTFSQMGKKVLILDADLGLGNIDVLLGIAPKYNLSHVITEQKRISDIIINGPGNIKILPASSGIQELTRLTIDQRVRILAELDLLLDDIDIVLIDTAAGISSNVMYFNVSAQEIIVVISPEPTSITDAYALIKVLSTKYSEKYFNIIINQVVDEEEAYDIFRQISLVADKFLDVSLEYLGHVLFDKNIIKSIKRQKLVGEIYPNGSANRCFKVLSKKINGLSSSHLASKEATFFWENIFQNQFE